jgi:plastocyanin
MHVSKVAKSLVGLAAVLALVGAACSKSSSPSTNPTQPPAISASATSAPPSAAGAMVQQGAGGFVFSPMTLTVKKGESITVTNMGSASHTFTITDKGIDVVNSPGQSQSVTVNLAPGTYQFICRFHVSLGMKGTLTVTS